jgi:hypothetical protein
MALSLPKRAREVILSLLRLSTGIINFLNFIKMGVEKTIGSSNFV